MKSKKKKSTLTSRTIDDARDEVRRADANARAAKEKARSAKSSLKAAKKALKAVEKTAKKARKDLRRARKQLEILLARQGAQKKPTVAAKRSRREKPAPAESVATPPSPQVRPEFAEPAVVKHAPGDPTL
jgi:hypothetical protein